MNLTKEILTLSVYHQEKQRMTDKLEDTSLRLKDEMDLYRKMMEKLKQNREQFQKEKDAMQEVGGLSKQPLKFQHLIHHLCVIFLFLQNLVSSKANKSLSNMI